MRNYKCEMMSYIPIDGHVVAMVIENEEKVYECSCRMTIYFKSVFKENSTSTVW